MKVVFAPGARTDIVRRERGGRRIGRTRRRPWRLSSLTRFERCRRSRGRCRASVASVLSRSADTTSRACTGTSTFTSRRAATSSCLRSGEPSVGSCPSSGRALSPAADARPVVSARHRRPVARLRCGSQTRSPRATSPSLPHRDDARRSGRRILGALAREARCFGAEQAADEVKREIEAARHAAGGDEVAVVDDA